MSFEWNKSETERGPERSYRINTKGVNYRSKYVTQVQQQRPESPSVTLTWHACKHKVHILHHRYMLVYSRGCISGGVYVTCITRMPGES